MASKLQWNLYINTVLKYRSSGLSRQNIHLVVYQGRIFATQLDSVCYRLPILQYLSYIVECFFTFYTGLYSKVAQIYVVVVLLS